METTKMNKTKINLPEDVLKLAYAFDDNFKNFIKKEAKRRNFDIAEMLDYFAEHVEDLTQLLPIPGQLSIFKEYKDLKQFSKTYIQSDIHNILTKIATGKKLEKKGTGNIDIPTIGKDPIKGEMMIWTNKGIEYFVKADDILKFKGKNPKPYVTQIKNISLLMGMAQEQQFNNFPKEAKCEFTLSYYAERRGYTDKELQAGGKKYDELKRDLYTGAYTTYRIDKVMIEGKEYIAHGIPNFYTLYEPKEHNSKWKVKFNDPYSGWLKDVLSGEAGKYFVSNYKAIEDRETTNKPYLFLFYMQLIKRKLLHKLNTFPVKIEALLFDMQIPKKILARPKECFKVLKECLIYFADHYQPTPELESFTIYNNFNKAKTLKKSINIKTILENQEYSYFKELISCWNVKDIREAYISFKRPYSQSKSNPELSEENIELRNDILEWAKSWETLRNYSIDKTEEERNKFIDDRIRFLGHELVGELFKEEKNKDKPHAYNFLIHVLSGTENYEDIDWDNY